MHILQEIPVVVTATNKQTSSGVISRVEIPAALRRGRAVKTLALCWLAAVVSVAIPGFHFILVPGFFIAGIGGAIYHLRQKIRLTSTGIECPDCHKLVPVPPLKEQWPLDFQCPSCSRRMWMEKGN